MQPVKSHASKLFSAAVLAFVMSGVSAFATPGQTFNLSSFKLQTPIASGSDILEINQPQLTTYTSSNFYANSDGPMVFWTPVTGATTSGSSYPRCELRQNTEWNTNTSGTRTQTGTCRILQAPSTGKIIFAQIHGSVSGSELLKLRWTNGTVLAGVKTSVGNSEAQTTVKTGLGLGATITYLIRIQNNLLTVTVNGTTKTFNLSASSWSGKPVYFKAGCYIEDNSGSSSEGGRVSYSAFNPSGS